MNESRPDQWETYRISSGTSSILSECMETALTTALRPLLTLFERCIRASLHEFCLRDKREFRPLGFLDDFSGILVITERNPFVLNGVLMNL